MSTARARQSSYHPSAWARFRRWARQEALGAHFVLFFVLLIILIPLLWLIGTTFKDNVEFASNPGNVIPTRFSLVNYKYMLTAVENLPIYMRNSFFVAFGTVALQVFICSLAGYAFARMEFRFRDVIFLSILISMFIPRSGGLMALYELMTFLKLRNNLIGLILLFGAGIPVPLFIMRQSFMAVPKEIEEAARIDGASWFRVFARIALPIASGGMIVIATMSFVSVWSDFLVTFTMIDRDSQMTISIGIQKILASSYEMALSPRFRGQFAGEAADATALLFAAIPVVTLYAVLQRWFMRGLAEGAVKF